MRLVVFIISLFFLFPAQAVVLDWSGSYQVEYRVLQEGDFENWGFSTFFHNLHLKPDIKAFDGVRVRSWWHLSPRVHSSSWDLAGRTFYTQEGIHFGLGDTATDFPPIISVRDLYLEVTHNFGLFRIGWKPHHFGLGMSYNDSSELFSPVYNGEGSRGFISWRGFIGSSYYIQPMLHYIDSALFNVFIQAGFTQNQYGVELMYKTTPQGVEDHSRTEAQESASHLGAYAYYKLPEVLTLHLEVGRTSDQVYGGAVKGDWQSPIQWLTMGLAMGLSTSDKDKAFYFDPSFSSLISFAVEAYEQGKQMSGIIDPAEEEKISSSGYSFHSAFYISPAFVFSLSDSVNLESAFSTHLSYSEGDVLLYHGELTLQYELSEGLVWNTAIAILFPKEDDWHMGFISQAAITF